MELSLNPFGGYFLKSKNKKDAENEAQIKRNSQGVSETEAALLDSMNMAYSNSSNQDVTAGFSSMQAAFRSTFANKAQKLATYKEMSFFPEIVDALSVICDEAITPDENGKFVKLKILKEIPGREEKHIRKTFDYICNEVLKFDQRGWELFRTWIIDSELFIEKVLNDTGTKIIGMKVLPSSTMYPVYDGNIIKYFVQTTKKVSNYNVGMQTTYETKFEPEQICYVNYGQYGINVLDVRGYLEPSIRTWNQLRNLEDALIIYRLVRAPERRLWNVEMDRMPRGKQEEALRNIINRYKKEFTYNTDSGYVDSKKLFQALTNDIWFAKSEGRGTDVQVLQSGMNLGEIEDVNYFLRKMYKTLQIPRSRWEDTLNTVASNMAPGEITREEVKFSRFVGRLRNRFKKVFLDLLTTQLRLSNNIDQKYTRESLFDIEYCEENQFAEQKHLMNLKSRLEVMQMASADIASKDNPNGLWPKQYVMQEIWGLSEQEYQEMQNLIKEEIAEQEANGDSTGGDTGVGTEETGDEDMSSMPSVTPTGSEKTDSTAEAEGEATDNAEAAPDANANEPAAGNEIIIP